MIEGGEINQEVWPSARVEVVLSTYFQSPNLIEDEDGLGVLISKLQEEKCLGQSVLEREEDFRSIIEDIVTRKWHPIYRKLLQASDEELAFPFFLQLCEEYALTELTGVYSCDVNPDAEPLTDKEDEKALSDGKASDVAQVISSAIAHKDNKSYFLEMKQYLQRKKLSYADNIQEKLWGLGSDSYSDPTSPANKPNKPPASTVVTEDHIANENTGKRRKKKSIEDLNMPKLEDLDHLREAGLTEVLLEAISSYYEMASSKSSKDLIGIIQLAKSLNIDRQSLMSDIKSTTQSLNALIAMHWHPLHQIMTFNTITDYDDFLQLCKNYAPRELQGARSGLAGNRLSIVVNSKGERKAGRSNYSDLGLSIAYTIAMHDPAYNMDGVKNENYLVSYRNAMKTKRYTYAHAVANNILNIDIKQRGRAEKNADPLHLATDSTEYDEQEISSLSSKHADEEEEKGSGQMSSPTEVMIDISPGQDETTLNQDNYITESVVTEPAAVSTVNEHVKSAEDTKTSIAIEEKQQEALKNIPRSAFDRRSYPIYEPDVAKLEAKYFAVFFTHSPAKANALLFQECLQMVQQMPGFSVEKKEKVARTLIEKQKQLEEKSTHGKMGEQVWRLYFETRKVLKGQEIRIELEKKTQEYDSEIAYCHRKSHESQKSDSNFDVYDRVFGSSEDTPSGRKRKSEDL